MNEGVTGKVFSGYMMTIAELFVGHKKTSVNTK